jgi:hypothetical protein
VFATYYWYLRRHQWNTQKDLHTIFFLALITSPFTWTYDFVMLVIPLFVGNVILSSHEPPKLPILLRGTYIIINFIPGDSIDFFRFLYYLVRTSFIHRVYNSPINTLFVQTKSIIWVLGILIYIQRINHAISKTKT